MRTTHKLATAAFGAAFLLPMGMSSAYAADGDLNANLAPVALNVVEGSGTAMVKVQGTTVTVTMAATGLLADSPTPPTSTSGPKRATSAQWPQTTSARTAR
ncbi:hypothetical protein [Pengzhenrongella frigida]|uniref:hypothetical protein n=1 Tax=Pengzhenrongella frigida TaxID=1259133 RepID=UPI001F5D52A6|nr:hypothetical protein [Cellulomonas sp. HLT2-17]